MPKKELTHVSDVALPQGPHYEFPPETEKADAIQKRREELVNAGRDIVVGSSLMDTIQIAVRQNASVETLEKLWQLQLQIQANDAKNAYHVAMNAFKADPPEILKNKHVAYNQVAYDHATLDHVCEAAGEGLAKHDISHRWKVEQKPDLVRVTCILTHSMGHSEETTLEGPIDTSGSKNAIQSIGSSVTYLERYSLLAAVGLAAKNGDNDGQGAPKMENLQLHLDRIAGATNTTVLQNAYNDAFKEAVKLNNTQAMQAIVKAKDAKKALLLKEKVEGLQNEEPAS